MEGEPRNEVALTFHSMADVIRARQYSIRKINCVYIGAKTLIVPANTVEQYRRLHPIVNEVFSAVVLPLEEKTTRSREQIIFSATTHGTFLANGNGRRQ